jgi:hypothetical protein
VIDITVHGVLRGGAPLIATWIRHQAARSLNFGAECRKLAANGAFEQNSGTFPSVIMKTKQYVARKCS